MAIGPGKYDDLCTYVTEQSGARAVVLIVFGGKRGDGFSVQADIQVAENLPALLHNVATALTADIAGDPKLTPPKQRAKKPRLN